VRIEWSPLALERVEDIAQYIAQDDPEAARRWVVALFDTVGRLADFPESGRLVPEVAVPRIREVIPGHLQPARACGDPHRAARQPAAAAGRDRR